MRTSIFVFCMSTLVLAACDGASSDGGGETENAYAFDTYLQGGANFVQLTAAGLPGGIATPATDRSDLPTGGSAVYDGVMFVGLDDGSDDDVFGTVRMTASFSGNSLTGSAGSFVNDDNEAVDGTLTISNGSFLSSIGPAIGTADVRGTVEFKAGTMTVDGEAAYGFTGDSGEYNFGAFADGDGTAQPSIGSPIDVELSWVAERQ